MDMDKLFEKSRRLKAPESLKVRVEREIVKSAASVNGYRWVDRLSNFFFENKKALAMAVVLVIVVIAIRVVPRGKETVSAPPSAAISAELTAFINETLAEVFINDQEPWSWSEEGEESGDFDRFFKDQLDEIYWLNGGNDYA